MEQKNDNKWIEDAFKEAQPKIDGKTIDEFAHTMVGYTLSFGPKAAAEATVAMMEHKSIATLVKCFFAAGYKVRMDEDKKGGEK
jgi:hypothetical protein